MKRKITLFALSGLLAVFGLVGCKDSSTNKEKFSFTVSLESGHTSVGVGEKDKLVVSYKAGDDKTERTFTATSADSTVLSVDSSTLEVSALKVGQTTITVTEKKSKSVRKLSLSAVDSFSGVKTYTNAGYDNKTEILGKLEKFATENFLTGISLFENGGLVMYNPRITKGTNNYITGYGFGILSEGSISSPLESETVEAWKNYYHSGTSSAPNKINFLNDKGSQVSDYFSYISSSYWGQKMNANKDGYDWYPVLAKGEPTPVNPDEYGYSDTWQFQVKTGKDGLTYDTLSTKENRKAFKGVGVELEDYLFAFKVLLNQKLGYARGSELAANKTSGIFNASKYYEATKEIDISNKEAIDNAFENVGVKIVDKATNTIQIQLLQSVNSFYAKYYLSSGLYEPINRDFFLLVGGDGYGAFKQEDNSSPVDNILSLAPYTLEYWEQDKLVCFKRNPNWVEFKDESLKDRYKIEGVHIDVITAAQTDSQAIFNEFLAGKLDAAGIPLAKVTEYKNDPRTTSTKGDSVFKLNVNSCTPKMWETLFGENGTITKTSKANYWDVKPWMSNKNFLRGLSASIDRETYAANRGNIASNNYFSSNYLSNPEEGISYNETQAHKDAIKNSFPDTYGYNREAAIQYFKTAVTELVNAGDLTLGTAKKPTEINIVIEWMTPSDPKDYGEEISSYIESAFNNEAVCGKKVILKVVNNAGTQDYSDVYYKHLMVGQFDLGFGSISGNALNPIDFMEVLKSDNSSGFTLNWGVDTSEVTSEIQYDGKCWSYDALWTAANTGGVFEKGYSIHPLSAKVTEIKEVVEGESSSIVVKVDFACLEVENIEYRFTNFDLYIIRAGNLTLETDVDYTIDLEKGEVVVTLNAETIAYLTKVLQNVYESDQIVFDVDGYGSIWEFEIYFDVKLGSARPASMYATALLPQA